MSIDPHERDAVVAGGERLDGAHVRAAATAEDERALGQLARDPQRLLAERVLLDNRGLGVGKRKPGRLGDRLSAFAPGTRHAHQAGRELASARVALVAGADRHRRERAAVRAPRAQAAQERSFVKRSKRRATCIPARS